MEGLAKFGKWLFIFFGILIALNLLIAAFDSRTPEQKAADAQKSIEKDVQRKKADEKRNSEESFLYACQRQLKEQLNDPDSYQRIDWGVTENKKGKLVAVIKYRAKNAYGGYVVQSYSCTSK